MRTPRVVAPGQAGGASGGGVVAAGFSVHEIDR